VRRREQDRLHAPVLRDNPQQLDLQRQFRWHRADEPHASVIVETFRNGLFDDSVYAEYLNDLSNTNSWVPLATNLLTSNPYFRVDVSSTNPPRRFYRSVRVP
jgi:hypothetical protein